MDGVRDKLYFGATEVWLRRDPDGDAHAYTGDACTAATPTPLEVAFDTPDGARCVAVLPAVPGRPVSLCAGPAGAAEVLPAPLQTPLVKATRDAAGADAVRGAGSGVRSALVRCAGGAGVARLKGCGNNADGFPARVLGSSGGAAARADRRTPVEVRGCCFAATCARELQMTARVARVLGAHGVRGANEPLGWWCYGACAACPACPKCCGLYRTLGDRRAATHLLRGLELVVAALPPAGDAALMAALQPALSSTRLSSAGADTDAADEEAPVSTAMLCLSEAWDALADLAGVRAGVLADVPAGVRTCGDADLAAHAAACVQQLAGRPLALGALCARVGYEAGRLLRLLHAAHLSWGTYRDALAQHCNAHPNNYVVVAPGGGQEQEQPPRQWLAPLDFDMAFAADETSDSEEEFRGVQALEHSAMLLCLAGDALNTGCAAAPLPMPRRALARLQAALRDTLVRHCHAAYALPPAAPWVPVPRAVEHACRPLIELALCLSSSLIA